MTVNLEMTEPQLLEGSYLQETPQNWKNQLKKEGKIMTNEKTTMAKEILNQNNANNKCNEGELKMNENLFNGDDSEPNLSTGVDLTLTDTPKRAELKKGEHIMDEQKETMANEISDQQDVKNNFNKGELIMNDESIYNINSEYYDEEIFKYFYIPTTIILSETQYNMLKPLFDARKLKQDDIMCILLKFHFCGNYANIDYIEDINDYISGIPRYRPIDKEIEICNDGVWLSFPDKEPNDAVDYCGVRDGLLLKFVLREIYGCLC